MTRPGVARQPAAVDAPHPLRGLAAARPPPRPAMRGPSVRIQPSACSVPAASTVATAHPSIRTPLAHPSSASRGEPHGVEDLLVAGAAAEVARQGLADLGVARGGRAPQQVLGRHDQARRAEAALDRARCRRTPAARRPARPPARAPRRCARARPSAWRASTRQLHTSTSSIITEHEPHSPCSQAFLAPGRPSRSRRTYIRLSPSQIASATSWTSPLMRQREPHARVLLPAPGERAAPEHREGVAAVAGAAAHVVDRAGGRARPARRTGPQPASGSGVRPSQWPPSSSTPSRNASASAARMTVGAAEPMAVRTARLAGRARPRTSRRR